MTAASVVYSASLVLNLGLDIHFCSVRTSAIRNMVLEISRVRIATINYI